MAVGCQFILKQMKCLYDDVNNGFFVILNVMIVLQFKEVV